MAMAALMKLGFSKYLFTGVYSRKLIDIPAKSITTCKISIKNLFKTYPIGQKVEIVGWVRAIRKQKENLFLDINDGSTFQRLQIVSKSSEAPSELSYGCSVEISGLLVESTHSAQPFELKPDVIKVVGSCDALKYPILARQQLTMDDIRTVPHLRSRTRVFGHILRIRSASTIAVHEVFEDLGFIHINTPIITSNDCEGAGEAFLVKGNLGDVSKEIKNEIFFDKDVFLSVSGQFHLEAMASALTNVYTIGPTFRAENSRTRHHLSEFYMIEAEMAFMTNLNELTRFIELFIKSLIQKIMEKCPEEVVQIHKYFEVEDNFDKLLNQRYNRMTYTEAVDTLNKLGDTTKLQWGQDLRKEHEKRLVKFCDNFPLFVTDFPVGLKSFYMMPSEDNPQTVAGVDLLVPEVGELCGGSVREHRYNEIDRKLQNLNLQESLRWYLDLRSFGSVSHAGFGMGFERFLQLILKVPNIKDVIPFPRWPHHCLT